MNFYTIIKSTFGDITKSLKSLISRVTAPVIFILCVFFFIYIVGSDIWQNGYTCMFPLSKNI